MEHLLNLIDAFARLGSFYVLNSIGLGIVFVVIFEGLQPFLKKMKAVHTYRLLWLMMALMVLCPLFLCGIHTSQSVVRAQVSGDPVVMESSALRSEAVNEVSVQPLATLKSNETQSSGYFVIGGLVWFAGVAFLLFRLVYGWHVLNRELSDGCVGDGTMRIIFDRCKRQLGIRQVVLHFSSFVNSPIAFGFLKPRVVVPVHLSNALSEDEIEQVMMHELAHIYRGDVWWYTIQNALQAILWCHPLVWVLGRKISAYREMACDDWAVQVGHGRTRYARCLVRLADISGADRAPVLGVGGGDNLRKRIENVVKGSSRSSRVNRRVFGIGLLMLFIVGYLAVRLGPLVDVPGRAEAYMKLAEYNTALAKILIGNPMPRGIGVSNKIVVVVKEGFWPDVEPQIKRLFLNPIYTPQPEFVYEVIHVEPDALDDFRAYRNLIVIDDGSLADPLSAFGETSDFQIRENVWASHQVVALVRATHSEQASQRLAIYGDRMTDAFDRALTDWLASLMYRAGVDESATQALSNDFGWQLKVPVSYDVLRDRSDQRMVAFSDQIDRRQMWLWVYWEEGVSPDQLTDDWCLDKRNEILNRFYAGDVTDLTDLKIHNTEFNGRLAVCLEGLWEDPKAFKGGPFKCYAIVDADRGRLYMIDMSIYAPNRSKALHMRQLDALAHTFEIDPSFAMKQ